MTVTLLVSPFLTAALFLLLYAAAAFVRDLRLFNAAPKGIRAAARLKPERFPAGLSGDGSADPRRAADPDLPAAGVPGNRR